MKLLFAAIAILGTIGSQSALACMPPQKDLTQIEYQRPWLGKLLSDKVVNAKVTELAGADARIASITFGEKYVITLTNGCEIIPALDYSKSSPGTCPILLPFLIESAVCK